MDFLQRLFFESPLRLGVFAFLLFAVVLFARRRLSAQAARYALPVVLLVILMLFVVQRTVVTRRERILQTLDAFVAAIADKDTAGFSRAIGQGYDSEDMDRAAVVEFIESALRSIDIYDTRFRRRDVAIEGNRAEMLLVALATVRIRGGAGEFHTGRWRIGWAREPGGWKIVSIRPERLDTVPIDTLRRLMPYVR